MGTPPACAGRDPPSERQNAADDPLENAEISAAEAELKAAQEKVAQLKAQKDQKKTGKAEAKKKAAEDHPPASRTNCGRCPEPSDAAARGYPPDRRHGTQLITGTSLVPHQRKADFEFWVASLKFTN